MSITDLWRGRGRRRAADRIPVLTGERDLWMLLALLQASQLAAARQERDSAKARNVVLAADLAALQEQDEAITEAHDELAARYREIEANLRNLCAVSSGAPADHAPAIPLRDPDETAEIYVSALWDAHGLPAVNAA